MVGFIRKLPLMVTRNSLYPVLHLLSHSLTHYSNHYYNYSKQMLQLICGFQRQIIASLEGNCGLARSFASSYQITGFSLGRAMLMAKNNLYTVMVRDQYFCFVSLFKSVSIFSSQFFPLVLTASIKY